MTAIPIVAFLFGRVCNCLGSRFVLCLLGDFFLLDLTGLDRVNPNRS